MQDGLDLLLIPPFISSTTSQHSHECRADLAPSSVALSRRGARGTRHFSTPMPSQGPLG